jgi:nicotinate-nucleotide pyrophosphorylase (carboxylating)
MVARGAGVVAGVEVARTVFETVDPEVDFEAKIADGVVVERGDVIARVSGPARSILTAERTALNLISRMSGVATATRALVEAVVGTAARITDTRKTMPGLRALDKHAVVVGGGVNHRMGLHDAVLIKDNHIAAAGGITGAVEAARARVGNSVMVEVEVGDMAQLVEAMTTDADRLMLDNMGIEEMAEAVRRVGGAKSVEASGGVTLETVREIAMTGVDYISVGWITHSAPQLDIALDFLG